MHTKRNPEECTKPMNTTERERGRCALRALCSNKCERIKNCSEWIGYKTYCDPNTHTHIKKCLCHINSFLWAFPNHNENDIFHICSFTSRHLIWIYLRFVRDTQRRDNSSTTRNKQGSGVSERRKHRETLSKTNSTIQALNAQQPNSLSFLFSLSLSFCWSHTHSWCVCHIERVNAVGHITSTVQHCLYATITKFVQIDSNRKCAENAVQCIAPCTL